MRGEVAEVRSLPTKPSLRELARLFPLFQEANVPKMICRGEDCLSNTIHSHEMDRQMDQITEMKYEN